MAALLQILQRDETPMSQDPSGEAFWTQRTRLQLILVGVAGIAFLVGLIAIVSTKLVH